MPWRGVDLNSEIATYGIGVAFFASVALLDRLRDNSAVLARPRLAFIAIGAFWMAHVFVWAFATTHIAADHCADTSFAPDVVMILLVARQSPVLPPCRT